MADLYVIANNTNCASSSSLPEQQPDEISVFLQQILLRSSSSSPCLPVAPCGNIQAENQEPVMVPGPGRIYKPRSNLSTGLCYTGNNRLSSLARALDNELDECDYESEEGGEAVAPKPPPPPPRGSSKRTRAAEVHNLSEKRRRSRINEKMKALQNLIPNSNKTDKASMLDEAIEYLKQLQLQLQMLTVRNGLSLYPFCFPGMLQPYQIPHMRTDAPERNKSLNMSVSKAIFMDQNISAGAVQDNSVKRAPVAGFSTMIGSKTSYEIGQPIQDQFQPFQLPGSSRVICQQRNKDCPQMGSTGKAYYPGAESTSSIPFEPQTDSKNGTLEACLAGIHNHFSSQLDM